jgi:hypothetical protein
MENIYEKVKRLEEANENILGELWIAIQEVKKLKHVNHQCLNWIEQQKYEKKQLTNIIEDLTLENKMLKCKL